MKDIEVILPVLKELGKKWYVEFYAFNPASQKLERFRVYKGFARLDSPDKKRAHGHVLVKEYEAKLRAGWRPWAQLNVIYKDETASAYDQRRYGSTRNDSFLLRKYASEFLTQKKEGFAFKTYSSYKTTIKDFITWLVNNGYSDMLPNAIDNSIMQQYFSDLKAQGLARATIDKRKTLLGSFFKLLQKKKLVNENPIYDIVLPKKTADYAARPMLDSDVELLLKTAVGKDPQFFLACIFQLLLGCRPGNELRLLRIGDIDIYNKRVYIQPLSGKTGQRMIQMPQVLAEVCTKFKLHSYPQELYIFGRYGQPGTIPLSINTLGNKFREYRMILKFPKTYKFYSLKHTGAGKLLESGASIIEVMQLLGHAAISSTYHYIRRHFGEQSEKVRNFCPDSVKNVLGFFDK